MPAFQNESVNRLFAVIAALNDPKEVEALLTDLCTIRELQDMALRFDTAVLLSKGMSYNKIVEQTGASTATISRVNRCLMYGAEGYGKAIEKAKEAGLVEKEE